MNKKKINYERLRELIEESLMPNTVTTTDAIWKAVRGFPHTGGYSIIASETRKVIKELIEQGRAERICHGKYRILKNK